MDIRHHRNSLLWPVAFLVVGTQFVPTALGQVASVPCGTPPKPIIGTIPFQDITGQVGYQVLAAPTFDTMSDYIGGGEASCTVNGNFDLFSTGPWATPRLAASISLPFPFGFAGIYADGGSLAAPFEINVWANGILTFDPSVSFNPLAYPFQDAPPNCSGSFASFSYIVANGASSNTFGGLPFGRPYPAPNALIAPWWGDLSLCPNNGQVGWLYTLDDEGDPIAVIQWTNATASAVPPNCGDNCWGMVNFSSCTDPSGANLYPGASLPQFTFQVRLHANNDVDFVYGPAKNLTPSGGCYSQAVGNCNYVSGIQSTLVFPDGVRPPLMDYAITSFNCTNNGDGPGCPQNQYPSKNTGVTYHDVFRSVGPDLQIAAITPPRLIPQGGSVTVPVQLSNGGGADSTGEGQVQFYFVAGGQTPQGTPFSLQSVPKLQACAVQTFNAQVSMPISIGQGAGYLIAEFIPGAESTDQTHTFANAAVVVSPPQPDLAALGSLAFSPAAVLAGQELDLSFTAANVGGVDLPATSYGIYASINGSITPTGIQLGGGPLPALKIGDTTPVSLKVRMPLTLTSGEYLLGAVVDPASTLVGDNQSNNTITTKKLLTFTSLGPLVVTKSLPDAYVGASYSVQLRAVAGDGHYSWSISPNTPLPAGLSLTKAGLIVGQAPSSGTTTFTVKVTDGVNHSATQALTLTVDDFSLALAIETVALPAGSTTQPYRFTVAAVGGTPPYLWSLVPNSGTLPTGIVLNSNGTLAGQPQFDGVSNFRVTVADAVGATVTSPLYTLTIFAGGTLAISSTVLPPATLNKTYNTTLHYAGGVGPYHWSLADVVREPAAPGDLGTDLGSNLPTGLNLYDQGQIEGVPTEVGVFAVSVQVSDSETPPEIADGLVLLTISSTDSFAFATVQVPAAMANAFYQTILTTNAPPTDTVTYRILDTSLLPAGFTYKPLPAGLTLYSDGQIQGVPLESGQFPFLAEAIDTQGGIATQSFSLVVLHDAVAGSGCQTAPGLPVFGGLVLLALTRLRRSRRK